MYLLGVLGAEVGEFAETPRRRGVFVLVACLYDGGVSDAKVNGFVAALKK